MIFFLAQAIFFTSHLLRPDPQERMSEYYFQNTSSAPVSSIPWRKSGSRKGAMEVKSVQCGIIFPRNLMQVCAHKWASKFFPYIFSQIRQFLRQRFRGDASENCEVKHKSAKVKKTNRMMKDMIYPKSQELSDRFKYLQNWKTNMGFLFSWMDVCAKIGDHLLLYNHWIGRKNCAHDSHKLSSGSVLQWDKMLIFVQNWNVRNWGNLPNLRNLRNPRKSKIPMECPNIARIPVHIELAGHFRMSKNIPM